MERTEHYQLCLWEKDDPVLRTDFNENNEKLDAILAGQLQFAAGEYTGDGKAGKEHPNRIEFPFKPLLVVVNDPTSSNYGGMLWLRGASGGPSFHNSSTVTAVSLIWEDHAVSWYDSSGSLYIQLSKAGITYTYFALGVLD